MPVEILHPFNINGVRYSGREREKREREKRER
jgi:hypothetical protein